jgi:hypothetical protein
MGSIRLTDKLWLDITAASGDAKSTLNRYLQAALVFVCRELDPGFRDLEKRPISKLDANRFPLVFSADVSRSFAVSKATLNVKAGGSGSLDLLTGDKAQGFLACLALDTPPLPDLLSFGITGTLESGPAATIGDFSFGLSSGEEITITNYAHVAGTDLFADGAKRAISGFTIPHDLDDLRQMPENSICRVQGTGTLKFTASVSYNFLNNSLASLPLNAISQSLDVKAQSGATLQFVVEHTSSHALTIASMPGNKLRLSVGLTTTDDLETSLELSLGVTANMADQDALEFLVHRISPSAEKELGEIRAALPPEAQSKLGAELKKVLQGAAATGVKASLREAFEKSKERAHLFVYDADLNALDADSIKALESALRGDFTQITAGRGNLAGIREVETVLTLTLTTTHTLTMHLIGILNFKDVSSFVQKATAGLNKDTGEIVLAAEEIKVVENNLDPDHLREVLLRSAMITTAAASSPSSPNFSFKMVFFLRKGQTSRSDMRQFANVLRAVASPDAKKAEDLLAQSVKHFGAASVYLSLDLNKDLSLALFRNGDKARTGDDYVLAAQNAMAAMLGGDEDSENRLELFSVDLNFWKQLRDAGTRQNILALLATKGITNTASPVDFFGIDWWATAMSRVASALANGQPLLDAEKSALKKSEGGFDIPWALLATYLLLGRRTGVMSQFTVTAPLAVGGRSSALR